MHGLVFERAGSVRYRTDLPEPRIEDPGDAVVAVSHSGLCGSDLHPYEGREPARPGVIPGHEAIGHVVAIGPQVSTVTVGTRVIVPFTTSCGGCPPCRRGLTARCERGRLFGWGDPDHPDAPALQGAQAQFVRVPLADSTLVTIPADLDPDVALLLTDNLPTAWEAVQRAAPRPDQPLIVVGLGSVGLCAVIAARSSGAAPVIGIDPVAARRARATRLGATVVADPADTDRIDAAPAVVEAAGTLPAQRTAADLVRPGGTLSIISVQTTASFAVSPIEAYDRNLTIRAGRASVRHTLDDLLPRVVHGAVSVPAAQIITHRDIPLSDGPQLFERFAARSDGLIKASFAPH
jgi:alcohol dehydrogenase